MQTAIQIQVMIQQIQTRIQIQVKIQMNLQMHMQMQMKTQILTHARILRDDIRVLCKHVIYIIIMIYYKIYIGVLEYMCVYHKYSDIRVGACANESVYIPDCYIQKTCA